MSDLIRKIYIDSRYRTSTSLSSSDFEVELPETLTIMKNALGWDSFNGIKWIYYEPSINFHLISSCHDVNFLYCGSNSTNRYKDKKGRYKIR